VRHPRNRRETARNSRETSAKHPRIRAGNPPRLDLHDQPSGDYETCQHPVAKNRYTSHHVAAVSRPCREFQCPPLGNYCCEQRLWGVNVVQSGPSGFTPRSVASGDGEHFDVHSIARRREVAAGCWRTGDSTVSQHVAAIGHHEAGRGHSRSHSRSPAGCTPACRIGVAQVRCSKPVCREHVATCRARVASVSRACHAVSRACRAVSRACRERVAGMSRRVARRRAASHNVVRSHPTGPLSPSPLGHSAPCRSGQLPRSRTSERVLAAGAIIR
jgi:hypothetical protein